MWIALILLAAVILAILLLPVRLIVKNNENEPIILQIKVLWFTFGGKLKPDSPAHKAVKKADTGSGSIKERIQTKGLTQAISEIYGLVTELLKIAAKLLGHCVVTKLHIQIRCAGNDAAATAIHYGQCCAATHGLVTAVRAFIPVRQRGYDVDIGCDFSGGESLLRYHVELSFRVIHGLAAGLRLLLSEKFRKLLPRE